MLRKCKEIGFFGIALVACLACTVIINATIYFWIAVADLIELGQNWLFITGLSLVEVASCVLVVNELHTKLFYPKEWEEEHAFDDIED